MAKSLFYNPLKFATGQEMVRGKNSSRSTKIEELYFESGKIDILKKSRGKVKWFIVANLMALKVGGNIRGHCDLHSIFLR